MVRVIVDCDKRIILFPAPVFLPGNAVAEQAAVRGLRKSIVQIHKRLIVPFHTVDHAGRIDRRGDLPILDDIGDLVGNDLPAAPAVERNGIRIQKRKRFVLAAHMRKAAIHQLLHDALAGILRIGAHTRHKADRINLAIDVHLQRIDCELRRKRLSIEAADHVRAVKDREL